MLMQDNAEIGQEQIESAADQKPQAPKWLIDNIAEASKNARKIYFLYVSFLAYCALTVVSTSDRNIILNEQAHLPIVNLDVSLNGFFIVAPMMSILIFVYFQLYLQRLKGLTDDLRTNYAQTEKRRLYPWIINISEDPEPGVIGKMQMLTVKVSVWLSLPLVLSLLAFWYIKKHEPFWSYVVGSLSILGTLVSIWFWREYRSGNGTKGPSIFGIGDIALFGVILTFQISILTAFTPQAMNVGMGEYLRPYLCVDLSYQNLVSKPEHDYENIPWQKLRGVHLEGADLSFSVLERADLSRAHLAKAKLNSVILRKSNLQYANLQEAKLEYANLQECSLVYTNLQEGALRYADLKVANLEHANLEKARLGDTDLQKADLRHANLRGATLSYANLREATLVQADLWRAFLRYAILQNAELRAADMKEANLQGAKLQKAEASGVNLQEAILLYANLKEADLEGANLKQADLEGANLGRANLRNTDLREANLKKADLQKADLRKARLVGAKFLTIQQLSTVKTLYQAKLDPALDGPLREKYPHLFEKPSLDEEQSQGDTIGKKAE